MRLPFEHGPVDLVIEATDLDPYSLRPSFDVVVVVFSIISVPSLVRVWEYTPVFQNFHKAGGLIHLVGTHADVRNVQSQVSPGRQHVYAAKFAASSSRRVCALNRKEVREFWDGIIREWLQDAPVIEPPTPPSSPVRGHTECPNKWYRWLGLACLWPRKPRASV